MLIEFNNNQPLVKGHGGFENVYGDSSASERYTEAKLQKFTEEVLLKNLNDKVVDFVPNFDQSSMEPTVLPSRLPFILINGSFGIAAGGFSSSIPPHSIKSSIDITIDLINNPDKSITDLIHDNKFYPEFPHGGTADISDLIKLYSGEKKGSIPIQSTIHQEFDVSYKDRKYDALVVTEIPYMKRMNNIVSIIKEKQELFTGLKNLMDATEGDDLKYYILFEKGTNLDTAKSQILKYTPLQDTFNVTMNLVNNGKLIQYSSMKDIITDWIDFRRSTIKRIKMSVIKDLEKRIHVLKALIIILNKNNIDKIISLFKNGNSKQEIKNDLISKFGLDEIQADYVIELKLYQISKMEINNFINEKEDKEKLIKEELKYLKDSKTLDQLIIKELNDIKNSNYCKKPKHSCNYVNGFDNDNVEAAITDEEFLMIFTNDNFVKKIKLDAKTQKRSGKGISIGKIKEGSLPLDVIQCNSKDNMLLITDDGNIFRYKAYDIPENKSIATLGTNISSMVKNSKIVAVINANDKVLEDENTSFLVVTKKNLIKMVSISEFKRFGQSGIILSKLRDDDSVISCQLVNSNQNFRVISVNEDGMILNLDKNSIPLIGRVSYGSSLFKYDKEKGISNIVGSNVIYLNDNNESRSGVFVLTKNGLGKLVRFEDIPFNSRYTKGTMIAKLKTGDKIAHADTYNYDTIDNDKLMVISKKKSITIELNTVREVKRPTYGNKIQNLDDDDSIMSASIIKE